MRESEEFVRVDGQCDMRCVMDGSRFTERQLAHDVKFFGRQMQRHTGFD